MYREVQAKAVKDVPAETFIKAYAAHLKSTDKVRLELWQCVQQSQKVEARAAASSRASAAGSFSLPFDDFIGSGGV